MKLIPFSLLALFALLAAPFAIAADIWSEDFENQEGMGLYGDKSLGIVTNMAGITNWTVLGGGGSEGIGTDTTLNWWMVTNGVFEGQDVGDNIGYWQSRSIDVSAEDKVQIKMNFSKVGNGCSIVSEYFKVNYSLNGGSEVTLLQIGTTNQDLLSGTTWTSAVIDASSTTGIVIEGRIKIGGGGDGWSFDNVTLQSPILNRPPVLSPIGDHALGSGSDLMFTVSAADAIDGNSVTLFASNLPPGAVFSTVSNTTAVSNSFTWTSANPVGVYTTTFYAADADGIDSETIEIAVAGFAGGDSKVWINELHYDNTGTDTNEGVEVAGYARVNLSNYVLYRYNGTGGEPYGTYPLLGVINDEVNGLGAHWFNWVLLQNGPDGLALTEEANGETNLLQFISYGGAFIAVGGPADGVQSIDIGVYEDGAPEGQSLQLIGKGKDYAGFTWTGPSAHSRGDLNSGQTVTIPGTLIIVR
jgi:hypothetical protein